MTNIGLQPYAHHASYYTGSENCFKINREDMSPELPSVQNYVTLSIVISLTDLDKRTL